MTEEDTFKTLSRIPYNQLIEKLGGWHEMTVVDTRQRFLDNVANRKEIKKSEIMNKCRIFGFVEPILINLSFSRENRLASLNSNIRFNGTGWDPEDYLKKVESECAKDLAMAEKIKRGRKNISRAIFALCTGLGGVAGYFIGALNIYLFVVPLIIVIAGMIISSILQNHYFESTQNTKDFEKVL